MPEPGPSQPASARWRMMKPGDLPAVFEISRVVHPNFPEGLAVFQERLSLFGAGCLLLHRPDQAPLGYCVSHPWICGNAPALDTPLGRMPGDADVLFIHDVALLPPARGGNHGGQVLRIIGDLCRFTGLSRIELVSVGGSASFWIRHGFAPTEDPALQAKVRATYADQAVHMYRAVEPFFD